MIGDVIADPQTFLQELGSLHDVRVLSVLYAVERKVMEIAFHDLNWNSERQADYTSRPAKLIFSDVSAFAIAAGQDRFHTSIAAAEPAAISESYAIVKNGITRIDIVLSTSERWYVEFGTMSVLDESVLR